MLADVVTMIGTLDIVFGATRLVTSRPIEKMSPFGFLSVLKR